MVTTTFSGRQAKVAVDVDSGVAYTDADQVEEVSIEHAQDITEVYQLGDTDPQELKEGTISISGSITRKYEAGNFSAAATTFFGMATESGVKTPYWIAIFPEGDALPKILASNAKFHNHRWNPLGIDGILTETVDFKALALGLSE